MPWKWSSGSTNTLRSATTSPNARPSSKAAEDTYNPIDVTMIKQPALDPRLAEKYVRHFEKDGLISHFLKAANLPLRMLKSGNAAIVSYQIVVPEALSNILVLDASFPIRKLCHYDRTIKSAETLPGLKGQGVPAFHSLKKFDNVELYRLKSYGGRFSMEKRFKDRQMAKEVVQVLQDNPCRRSHPPLRVQDESAWRH